jgi:para-nitrobenzyl esterase
MTDPTACRIRYASQLLADQVPVYAYEFDYRKAPYYFPKMPGFVPLAAHTIDIQFLFPLYHGGPLGIPHPLNNKEEDLSDQLVYAWTNFAWTGNPNGLGNSPWPVYKNNKPNKPTYLSEDIPLANLTDAQYSTAHKCDFWKGVLLYN